MGYIRVLPAFDDASIDVAQDEAVLVLVGLAPGGEAAPRERDGDVGVVGDQLLDLLGDGGGAA